jgi:TonB family protein
MPFLFTWNTTMIRMLIISITGHILLFIGLVIMSFLQPRFTRIQKPKVMRINFAQKAPEKKLVKKVVKKIKKTTPPRKKKKAAIKNKITKKPVKKTTKKKKPAKRKKNSVQVAKAKKTPRPERRIYSPPKPKKTIYPPLPEKRKTIKKVSLPVKKTKAPLMVKNDSLPDYYLVKAQERIKQQFNLTAFQRVKGKICSVEFRVNREGEISRIKVLISTGNRNLDSIAVDALEQVMSLAPLPDSVRENSMIITANFDYSPL